MCGDRGTSRLSNTKNEKEKTDGVGKPVAAEYQGELGGTSHHTDLCLLLGLYWLITKIRTAATKACDASLWRLTLLDITIDTEQKE